MKNFFESIGFLATAVITGFLIFMMIGKSKNQPQNLTTETSATAAAKAEILTTHKNAGIEFEEDFAENIAGRTAGGNAEAKIGAVTTVSKTPRKTPAPEAIPVKKSTAEAKTAAPTNDLREIFTDEIFIQNLLSKWKSRVAKTASENEIRPGFLMANVLVQTYLGEYNSPDFQSDVAKHRGDAALPAATALRKYDNEKTIAALVKMYDLDRAAGFAAAKYTSKKEVKSEPISSAKKKSKDKLKPETHKPEVKKVGQSDSKISNAEAYSREMAAKEFGFSTWQGLQFLADPDTKTKAEKRVKTIMLASRIR